MGGRLRLRSPEPRLPIATLTTVDQGFLEDALQLARQAEGVVAPDPLVGALIVEAHTNTVVGRGFHATHGSAHAEPVALGDAGPRAQGATLYCNLEPCGYEAPEKRHPPCTRAIIGAGITRVVIGQLDPHPRVRGTGLERLRAAGIGIDLASDPRPFWIVNAEYVTRHALGRVLDPATDLVDGQPRESWFAAIEAEWR